MTVKKYPKSNMYPWVDEMISHLHGRCPHRCAYCYVLSTRTAGFYTGPLRLNEKAFLKIGRRDSKVLFFDHMNDLFAHAVPTEWILRVMDHALKLLTGQVPNRLIVFQTKNPARYLEPEIARMLNVLKAYGKGYLLGCTIEDTSPGILTVPAPVQRYAAMDRVAVVHPSFITIEPIQKMEVFRMLEWLREIRPLFVNIGADSKQHNLTEPSGDEVRELIAGIQALGIEIRVKHNLGRLLDKVDPP